MGIMPVTDSIFLFAESREHPMHVGSLELFTPPPDAGPHFVAELYDKLLSIEEVDETFRKRPGHPLSTRGYLWWSSDADVDLDYHVRHSALPPSGRIRDLFALISRLHGTLLDRHRPLWEMYVIEGIEGGRFAVYTKLHHSLLDGVAAQQLLRRTLSTDPGIDPDKVRAPWHLPQSAGTPASGGTRSPVPSLFGAVRALASGATEAVPAAWKLAQTAFGEHYVAFPYEAPATILNVPIGGARRFAAESWPLERIARARHAAGVTVNDFVLAMCSGALRAYLLEQNALPDDPLIAMVPISLRTKERLDAGGNAVGVTLCNLGTDQADPLRRLAVVSASMAQGKELFAGMTPIQALLWSAANIAPLGLAPVPGFVRLTPPPFNVIISNVPGPREELYWNGARLDGVFPTSVVLDGQALNITLTNTVDTLDFGVVGCRRSLPSLQRLLVHLEQSLADLESALGLT